MTLAGTRPPTLDEWEKYELHHRARLAIKPGITGMWQVSGRSDITDFEEVVKLDMKYIANWNFGLDIKILIKTVASVLRHESSVFQMQKNNLLWTRRFVKKKSCRSFLMVWISKRMKMAHICMC